MLQTTYLRRCVQSLESAVTMLKKSEAGSIEYDVFRNAAVKSFELSLETSGKLLRKVLKPYFATPKEVDRLVFKDVFRYAGKHDVLTLEAVSRWLAYRDNRNNTAHDYGQQFAEQTLLLLPEFIADAYALADWIDQQHE
ncbi:MAG: nucleotidyltransferase substrate binding protein [Mariprofundaceae bacterium]|nr:nucleotidyltransferase substrate binding protein [Mariprofundaceae bacterium]